MKLLPLALLLAAGGALAWIGLRSPERDYTPLSLDEPIDPERVPLAIVGDAPAGHVVRTFAVEGMCCNGCTGKLYAALTDRDDVAKAAVNFEAGTAAALVPESVDPADLAAALSFDKYSATPRP